MKSIKKFLGLTLALIIVLSCFVSCSSQGKTMMELEDSEISVNLFQLFLSRKKGSLCSGYGFGSTALSDSFWDTVMDKNGTTYNEYYTKEVLESTKTFLAALYVFEEKGLELPDSYIDEVDAEMDRLVEEDGEGSKRKLNAILADYGVNYKILREAYLLEAKISYLKDTLFGADGSLIAPNLVNDYYTQTYARFKQVFLYTYDYVYETDGDGEAIYYMKDGKTIAYDTSATLKVDANGTPVTDQNGNKIYVTEDGKIAYDKKNGTRKQKNDEKGNALLEDFTGNKLNQVIDEATQIYSQVTEGDFESFDKLVSEYSLDSGMQKYANGYYITETTDYDSPEVVEALFKLEVGQAQMVRSDYGIHIIMRYELEENGYAKDVNSDFFVSINTGNYVFMNDLKDQLLSDYLEQFKDKIVIDEALLSEADIKRIGANFYY